MDPVTADAPANIDWLLVIVGALFTLLGGLIYFLSLRLIGLLIGGGVGMLLAVAIAAGLDLGDVPSAILLVAGFVLGAIVGAVIARFAHKALFFLLGAAVGGAGAFAFGNALREGGATFMESDLILAFGVVLIAILAGVLAAVLDWFLVAFGTAVIGAALIMEGVRWQWGAWPFLVLVILGLIVQMALIKSRRGSRAVEGEEY